ncbi:winged helix DNA-binding domain-containing protein [Conidiobolus coronatus NRRL 28638]|uniref:Winged helix DNA-binding domain-containing protein n=1 Tax=Conidiobolus coronatus (strain ATCC 28846 / CBS 209.66 / NRRL 28638) TaxID=796925 RepID=A0A137P9W1_CONC2|nr:winged helix DNA-binding domain-containing protein [Conidiobolus coronatus NRRL 28638]|eukprot:KXN71796.1 winged helix DNA-binding domain-containing protein [Conidiobolus coronatus NRRL 28638]
MGDLIHISKLSFNNLTASNPEKQGDADPNLNFFVSNDYNIIKTNKSAFISRLYQTVEDPRCNTLQWDSEGKSFLITDYDRFEKYTLPNCFNNSSVTSFIRQLNLYGFKRTSDGRKLRGTAPNNFSSFAHQNFVQGQPHLIAKIKRQPRASKRGVFLLYPNEPTNSTPPVVTKPPPTMHPQIETETLTLPSSLRSAQMQSSLNIQRRDHPSREQPETWVNGTQKITLFKILLPLPKAKLFITSLLLLK